MLIDRDKSLVLLIDVQEKLFPFISEKDVLLEHCHWILSLAKELSVTTLVTEQYPKGLGQTINELTPYSEHSSVMTKTTISCVADPEISLALEASKREHYILIGIEAHACVMQTALELRSSGKEVFVVVEAIGSRQQSDKELACSRMQQQGVQLISREMLFFEWLPDSKAPEFKTLSKKFLK